jgi:hypothetical protein
MVVIDMLTAHNDEFEVKAAEIVGNSGYGPENGIDVVPTFITQIAARLRAEARADKAEQYLQRIREQIDAI